MRLYLDSNVFISFVKSEFGRDYRQLGTASEMLFAVCKKNKFEVILSELFFLEVNEKTHLTNEMVCETIQNLDVNFLIVDNPKNLEIKAVSVCKELAIHFSDAVHYVIALEEKADAFITFNKKDFLRVKEFPVLTPEEFTDSDF